MKGKHNGKLLVLLLLVGALLLRVVTMKKQVGLSLASFSSTATISLSPIADARVEEATPGTNFGTATYLRSENASDPDAQTYLRFNVSGVTGAIQQASLRLFVPSGYETTNGPAVYGTGNQWEETLITWTNKPSATTTGYDNKGSIPAGQWVEYDVTPLVTGNGLVSLLLIADSNDGVRFHSREAANQPQLVITALGGPTNTPAPSPTPGGPTPTPTSNVNVVLILTDDQAMPSLPLMPYLGSRPGGNWVEFTNAFLNVALCCPSRATILSGWYSHHHAVGNTNTSGGKFKDASTLATWLDQAGYTTALVGKYLNRYPFANRPVNYIPPGWDRWVAFSGTVDYYNYKLNEDGVTVAYGNTAADYSTDVLSRKAVEFINSANGPFFLMFTPNAPHDPYTPAPRHKYLYNSLHIEHTPNFNEADVSDKPAWVRSLSLLSTSTVATMDSRQRRAGEMLLAVDEGIKAVVEALQAKGVFDNTIIIYMTDNGYSFGSHRWINKSCGYEECIRTPMLIRYPGTTARVETELVQNIDIAPTVVELAGAVIPHPVDGKSLVPILTNSAVPWRSSILIRNGYILPRSFWGVRTETAKYMEMPETGEKELYDLVNDPYELVNVAGQPGFAQLQAELAAELLRLRL